MAKKRRRIKIERHRERIRYGRATLTIECSASVLMNPLEDALEEWRAGKKTDEEVAWVFIKRQTVKHSPSFDWENADLAVLLPRVTNVITEPVFTAQTPAELMDELEQLEQKNQATLDTSRELTTQWAGTFSNKAMSKIFEQFQPDFSKAFSNFTFNYDDVIESSLALSSMNLTLDPKLVTGMSSALTEQVNFSKMFSGSLVSTELVKGMSSALTEQVDFSKMFSGSVLKLHGTSLVDWTKWANEVTIAAKDIQFPEIAKAVEATSAATEPVSDVDALLKGLQPMFANLEKAMKSTKDSAARVILLVVAATLIAIVIQMTLAKFGIYVVQPTPPAQAPKTTPKLPKSTSGGTKPGKPSN